MRSQWGLVIAAAAVVLGALAPACNGDDDDVNVDCTSEAAAVQVQARAGEVQSDGSVTVYGTVQFGGSATGSELTVRAVYVAGVPVSLDANDFNFRSWSVAISADRIAAYADDGSEASLPVQAYLFGGCTMQLSPAQEPVVHIAPVGMGLGDAGDSSAAGGDGASDDGGDTSADDAADAPLGDD